MITELGVDEAGWLLRVDGLGERAIEECVVDVELMNWPVVGDSEREDGANVAGFTTGLNVSSKSMPACWEKP